VVSIKITIDDREPRDLIKKLRQIYPEIEWCVEKIKEGDYVTDKVICERKTISDLHSSIIDGRFDSQLNRIATHKKIYVFMVVGSVKDYCKALRYKKIFCSEDMLFGAIASVAVRYNMHVFWADNELECIHSVIQFMRQIDEGKYRIPSRSTHRVLLSRLFNIPMTSVDELFNKYGSIANIAMLTPKEISKIKYIGKVKSERILSVLHGTMHNDGNIR
jgi:DNA excision repair protein ERCC-4